MYKNHAFAGRRLQGWVERRDYFKRIFGSMRLKPVKREAIPEIALPAGSTERR